MKTYILDEIESGVFVFEGKNERLTLEELKALQQMQPDAQWIIFCEPETILDGTFKQQTK